MKKLNFYIEYYTIELVCYFIHEFSHWIMAFLIWLIRLFIPSRGKSKFPIIKVIRWADIEFNDNEGIAKGFHICVEVNNFNKHEVAVVIVMPLITSILLVIVGFYYNVFLGVLILSKFRTLNLSISDVNYLKDYLKL